MGIRLRRLSENAFGLFEVAAPGQSAGNKLGRQWIFVRRECRRYLFAQILRGQLLMRLFLGLQKGIRHQRAGAIFFANVRQCF